MADIDIVHLIFRWLHFLAGITWIGLLYFFNLVNVRFLGVLDASAKPHVIPTLLPRALAWFRHSAWVTVVAGLVLIERLYWRDGEMFSSPGDKTIFMGMVLGLIMLFNVWVFIWPNQKKVIEATKAGQPVNPAWGKTALFASRTNFILSFPMLLFMGGASHYPMDWSGIFPVGAVATAIGFVVVMSVQKWAAKSF